MTERLTLNPNHVIELWTHTGMCRIELLYGDITTLPRDEKVDFIMVSAFPGEYRPVPGSVLGALRHRLGVDLLELSYEKELDLRHHFNCWLSKPLSSSLNCPFDKVLCFESLMDRYPKSSMGVPAQIADIFRVFTPVFNNKNHSVATPLLATGFQGESKAAVLDAMVEAAASWIYAGLPLRLLKIVVYDNSDKNIETTFRRLKKKHLKKNKKMKARIFKKTHDIYFLHEPSDIQHAKAVKQQFLKSKSDLKIYMQTKKFKKNVVWQKEIFQTIVSCKRVVALLTPQFMSNCQCLDQYNMAMCCNRLFSMEVLAPLYMETISNLPSYMGLVQWIDCRIRKEGDTVSSKITTACSKILSSICDKPGTSQLRTKEKAAEKFEYDVFISYSHRNPEHAEKLLKTITAMNPDIRVFYDRSELTTGINWQHMLYQCVGECRCMVALVSRTYISSTVCTEEFNLALARHLCKDKGMRLIVVLIETLDDVPSHMTEDLEVVRVDDDFEKTASSLANDVIKWLSSQDSTETSNDPDDMTTDIIDTFADVRSTEVRQSYTLTGEKEFQRLLPLNLHRKVNDSKDNSTVHMALIYANDAVHLAGTFCALIDRQCPNLNISVHTSSDQERMTALETAKTIVLFITQQFVQSDGHMHELHMVMNRQRSEPTDFLYLIKAGPLHGRPFFPRILKYDLVTSDDVWSAFETIYHKGTIENGNDLAGSDAVWCDLETAVYKGLHSRERKIVYNKINRIGHSNTFHTRYAEYFAMVKASDDVLDFLFVQSASPQPHRPLLVNLRSPDLLKNGSGSTVPPVPHSVQIHNIQGPNAEESKNPNKQDAPSNMHDSRDEDGRL